MLGSYFIMSNNLQTLTASTVCKIALLQAPVNYTLH